jgi:hypothetical protein
MPVDVTRLGHSDYTWPGQPLTDIRANELYEGWRAWLSEKATQGALIQSHAVLLRNQVVRNLLKVQANIGLAQKYAYMRAILRIDGLIDAVYDDIVADPGILSLPGMQVFALLVTRSTQDDRVIRQWQQLGLSASAAAVAQQSIANQSSTGYTYTFTNAPSNKEASPNMFKTTAVRTIDGWVGQVISEGARTALGERRVTEQMIVWQSEPFNEDLLDDNGKVFKIAQTQAEEEAIAKVDEVIAKLFETGKHK